MEDQNTKIANLQVFISEKCSEREKEIINYYWELKENENFRYPKQIANIFGIGLTELKKIIGTHSELSFDFFCQHCSSYELQTINSITRYIEITKVKRQRNFHSGFKCAKCKQLDEEKVILEKKRSAKKIEAKI